MIAVVTMLVMVVGFLSGESSPTFVEKAFWTGVFILCMGLIVLGVLGILAVIEPPTAGVP